MTLAWIRQSLKMTAPSMWATSVSATGDGPLSYQRFIGDALNDGANGFTLTISGVPASDAGQYSVLVVNNVGSTTSLPAMLTVTP